MSGHVLRFSYRPRTRAFTLGVMLTATLPAAFAQAGLNTNHQNSWEWGYRNSKETAAYLKQDYDMSKRLLTELGMAAKP